MANGIFQTCHNSSCLYFSNFCASTIIPFQFFYFSFLNGSHGGWQELSKPFTRAHSCSASTSARLARAHAPPLQPAQTREPLCWHLHIFYGCLLARNPKPHVCSGQSERHVAPAPFVLLAWDIGVQYEWFAWRLHRTIHTIISNWHKQLVAYTGDLLTSFL